jgi:hypothetical protein
MAEGWRPAAELEAEARAINATDWRPLPGMVKRQCQRCRYWFAVKVEEADVTTCCPDCSRPTRPAPAP